MSETPVLSLEGVTRRFRSGDETLEILKGASFDLYPGEIVALVAPSGTGKSTLLHIAGLLESPQEGAVRVAGRETRTLSDTLRTQIRRDEIGFVYQFHHLLAEFSSLENVVLPQHVAGVAPREAKARATDLLTRFGLAHRLQNLPGKLSGGEKQRVAIARALANRPRLLLADEPTGNLDVHTSDAVFDELLHAVRSENVGALIATHNEELASRMDRVVTLRDGQIVAK
ncbi:ABC transporter ATP-binding protein [Asaia siamensis]|uniref:Lipoprotein-releasing system ATP-binding protein LolD 1 n=1 Tax=Asaia siamensis TaxID=110479 RepID=A0ABQ1MC25_9PROT|nr:ABC transporter ATP-binding protein [Asaia siamensis]GBR07566.1 lipoprotein releasing system ATP-binding protein LolD [Asaia siamensis NRIC 0323]GGC36666.1 lipoprotein-releasing system ATP-binding protein LolD 1 [Asaia siamensis]